MSTSRSSAGPRAGSALVAAMALVLMLASVSYILSDVMVSDFRQQGRRADEVTLLVTAESAANEAYAYFQASPSTTLPKSPNFLPVTYVEGDGSGMFTTGITHNNLRVQATATLLADADPTKWGDESYLLTSIATAGSTANPDFYRRRCVEMLIKPQLDHYFTRAMFAIDGYDFMGAATTDSYDSSVAAYAGALSGDHGDIGSKGALTVAKVDNVHGTAMGGQTNAVIPPCDYNVPAGAITVASAGSTGINGDYTIKNPGSYHTAFINLGGTLRLEGGGQIELWVDTYIAISKGHIQYDSKSTTLVIHQNDYTGATATEWGIGNTNLGEIVAVSGGASTGDSRPQQLQVYSKYEGSVKLNGTASINAVLCYPNGTFDLNGTFDFMGSLLVNSFNSKVNGTFNFHYDESLANLSPNLQPRLQVAGWRTFTLAYAP